MTLEQGCKRMIYPNLKQQIAQYYLDFIINRKMKEYWTFLTLPEAQAKLGDAVKLFGQHNLEFEIRDVHKNAQWLCENSVGEIVDLSPVEAITDFEKEETDSRYLIVRKIKAKTVVAYANIGDVWNFILAAADRCPYISEVVNLELIIKELGDDFRFFITNNEYFHRLYLKHLPLPNRMALWSLGEQT